MNDIRKIAVVGGGPIGLIAAYALSKLDYQIDIFEKGQWPIDKVCGEGIMSSGVKYLDRLGLTEELLTIPHHKFPGIAYIVESGKKVNGDFHGEEVGLAFRRVTLSQKLYEICRKVENINLYSGHKLTDFEQKNDEYQLSLTSSAGEEKYSGYSYLIAADGRLSPIRKKLNIADLNTKFGKRMAANFHVPQAPWSDRVEVFWSEHIEAYVTPLSDKLLGINLTWNSDQLTPNRDDLLSHVPKLKEKVTEAPISAPRFIGNLPHVSENVVKNNAILIGDAAVFLDGITGEGLSLGIEQAYHLQKAIRDNKLDEYNKKVNKVKSDYLFFTGKVLFLSRHPLIRKFAFFFLARIKGLFSYLIKINMGQ